MKEERYQKILDILSNGEYSSVESLSRTLYVSMPTVRRDLETMQEMGLVVRSHGGVIQRRVDDVSTPLLFRNGVNAAEKLRLANAASEVLRNDSVVFMDESSTTLHIIDQMPQYRNIKIITNSLSVLQLASRHKIPAYCLGGELSYETMATYGSATEEMLERFSIDLFFFASSGIDRRGWIVDYSDSATSLRRKLMRQAQTKVFLCDKSKFGKSAAFALAPLCDVDYVFLNAALPPEIPSEGAKIIVV